ncbi:rod shape-determining protein MreC [Sphingomonas sp.]|uniref:rod shape-determining protein MreC n=1 Tax=Sphingomonas sp. TaxID=28214 RepID=UPI003CC68E57
MAVSARDRRTGFSRRRQYGAFASYVVAVAGAVVGAVLLLLSRLDPPAFAAVRMTAASITVPVSAGLDTVAGWVAAIPDAIGDHFAVKSDNARLRGEISRNRALLARARSIVYDNRRLRALLAVRDRSVDVVVTARLVSSTASSGRRFALLDAGRWQGVHAGMPVTGPDGLVGRVVETGPAVARVLLLTDAESSVPVRRTRDGVPAIAVGRGDGLLDIRSVSTNTQLRPGDVFVTTGTGGIYAPGLPVARVMAAGEDNAPAVPIARPEALDFALVTRALMPAPGQ